MYITGVLICTMDRALNLFKDFFLYSATPSGSKTYNSFIIVYKDNYTGTVWHTMLLLPNEEGDIC